MSRAQLAERLARYRRRLRAGFPPVVSEGDSWFDYPLFLNLIDRIDDAALFAHLRLEKSGDTVAGMIATATDLRALRSVVAEEQPVCLLFSGGGNDLAAAAPQLFRGGTFADPAEHLIDDTLEDTFDRIERAVRNMVAEIGSLAPIFAHGYDYFQPSPKGVRIIVIRDVTGPWIQPEMLRAGIVDAGLQRAIARVLIDRFNMMLTGIARDHPLDFVHVDLRGTLDIDRDWANEIHPTRAGFQKVATTFVTVLRERLPALEGERTGRRLTVDDEE